MDAQRQSFTTPTAPVRDHDLRTNTQTAYLANCGDVDSIVGEENDSNGHVEGNDRGQNEIERIIGEKALSRLRRRRDDAPPGDGGKADGSRTEPNERDEEECASACHAALIGERVSDGPEAVEADECQIKDGSRACKHVQRVPHVAPVTTQRPRIFCE